MRTVNSRISFSGVEKADLAKAWIATSLAFTIFFLRGGFFDPAGISFLGFLVIFVIAAVTGGVGFIVHELCHKFTAYHFRVHGEFRSNDTMLVVSILFAIIGVLFAAPGAVYMFGMVSRRESGIISAAGPVANMVLALFFLPLVLFGTGVLLTIGQIGLMINAILGAFNLIPVWNFDGEKVFHWSKPAYFTLVVIAGALMVAAYALTGLI